MTTLQKRLNLTNVFLCLLISTILPALATAAGQKPNIVFILTDDLGQQDIGAFGQKKIRTPNLDRMASEGMRFTQHYSGNAVCAPSRCVLLTGKHPGHAAIRDNREIKPEGQQPLPASDITVAELLKAQGYTTGAFGKWGLGFPGSEGDPLNQGFDRFYGYNCQRIAHNFYPTFLRSNSNRVELDNPPIEVPQKLPADADPNNPASYARYTGKEYAPDLIETQTLDFIRQNKSKPFFLFVPTTVPHLSLQVPPDSLAEYRGAFPEEPYTGGRGYLPHLTPHAAYAAMITRFDRGVGRIMSLIKELGLDDNTIFIFASDNGPLYNRLGGTDADFFDSGGSLRGRKGSLYEGGIRVPLIVRWKGHITPGKTSNLVTGFEDWMPTLLELIDSKKSTPRGIDGISFAPTLLGKKQSPREFLYREFPNYGGQQSIRVGDWKAVRQQLNTPANRKLAPEDLPFELYNLKADPYEKTDVAEKHPDVVKKLKRLMREQHTTSTVFPFAALESKKPAE